MKISQVYLNQKSICQSIANQLSKPLVSLELLGSELWQKAEQELTFAIYKDDAPVAFLIAQHQGKHAIEILSIAVASSLQKQGLGKELLTKLYDYAEEQERPYLLVKLPSGHNDYFEQHGFEVLMQEANKPNLYFKTLNVEEKTEIAYEGDIY